MLNELEAKFDNLSTDLLSRRLSSISLLLAAQADRSLSRFTIGSSRLSRG